MNNDLSGSSQLWNEDLAPTSAAHRTWRWYHFAALWIGMVMCIPAYTLSASLIEAGMSAPQAVWTVFLANAIVLLPMLAIGHAGTKYGIPYAVLARASFGTSGAKLPALLRAVVACGWYGIQTWFGGSMIYTLLGVISGAPIGGEPLGWLGINGAQLLCFLAFWAIQFYFVVHGIDSIRRLETYTHRPRSSSASCCSGGCTTRPAASAPCGRSHRSSRRAAPRPGSSGKPSGPR